MEGDRINALMGPYNTPIQMYKPVSIYHCPTVVHAKFGLDRESAHAADFAAA